MNDEINCRLKKKDDHLTTSIAITTPQKVFSARMIMEKKNTYFTIEKHKELRANICVTEWPTMLL